MQHGIRGEFVDYGRQVFDYGRQVVSKGPPVPGAYRFADEVANVFQTFGITGECAGSEVSRANAEGQPPIQRAGRCRCCFLGSALTRGCEQIFESRDPSWRCCRVCCHCSSPRKTSSSWAADPCPGCLVSSPHYGICNCIGDLHPNGRGRERLYSARRDNGSEMKESRPDVKEGGHGKDQQRSVGGSAA